MSELNVKIQYYARVFRIEHYHFEARQKSSLYKALREICGCLALLMVDFFAFQERTVIRFRKSLPGEVSPDGGRTRVQREVGYARNVVSCFLGSYVQIPEIVRYDAADIAKLSDAVRPRRPGKLFSHTSDISRRSLSLLLYRFLHRIRRDSHGNILAGKIQSLRDSFL